MNSTTLETLAAIEDHLDCPEHADWRAVLRKLRADLDCLGGVRAAAAAAGGKEQAAIDAASMLWPVMVHGSFAAVVDAISAAMTAARDGWTPDKVAAALERAADAATLAERERCAQTIRAWQRAALVSRAYDRDYGHQDHDRLWAEAEALAPYVVSDGEEIERRG